MPPSSSMMPAAAQPGERFQFERQGYFCVDPDSAAGGLVFNRSVSLRDSWAKIEKAQKEYYLTDIVALANSEGKKVFPFRVEDPLEVMGINTLIRGLRTGRLGSGEMMERTHVRCYEVLGGEQQASAVRLARAVVP